MKYQLQNNTILKDGFPMTLDQVVNLLNTANFKDDTQVKVNKSTGFNLFWSLYPKKVDKVNALKKWASLGLYNNAKINEVMTGLRNQLNSKDERFTREKQYIKSPTVYLNGECWNDEIIVKKENHVKWLTDEQVDNFSRPGETYPDLFMRLSAGGYSFNKNRS